MRKQIMTLEQLAEYCKSNNMTHFSANDNDKTIVAQTFGQVDFECDEESDLIPVECKAFHTLENRNMSSISKEVAKACMKSMINKPILAEIVENEIDRGVDADGNSYVKTEKDFGSHAMEYYEDADGEWRVRYIERCVGIINESSKIRIKHDAQMGKDYVCATGYIYRHYGNETYEILKRRGGTTKCSVEIEVKDFDFKDGVLNINDFSVMGLTLLGNSVMEGMAGSKVDLANFDHNEFELTYKNQLEEMNAKIDSILSKFDIDTTRKEDTVMENENIQVNEEVETVEVEAAEVTEVETEAVETEAAEVAETSASEETPEVVETESTEEVETEACGDKKKKCEADEEETETEEEACGDKKKRCDAETEEEVETEEEACGDKKKKCEIDADEYEALKNEYEEYKASHSHTDEEFNTLQEYHDNAESAKMHSQREEILNSEKFAMLKDCEEFKTLIKEMDNYSLTDLEREAKIIKADYVDVAVFAAKPEKKAFGGLFMSNSHSEEDAIKKQPYGGIFSNYKK